MERPILFSTSMVRAILDGRKTQTRRTTGLKKINDPAFIDDYSWKGFLDSCPDKTIHVIARGWRGFGWIETLHIKCPYGRPEDILWVRETFYALGKWVKNGTTKTGKQKYKFEDRTFIMDHYYMYETASKKPAIVETKKDGLIHWYKRPSIFMPKEACRIKLLIKNFRVERLQDIAKDENIEDIASEGVPKSPFLMYSNDGEGGYLKDFNTEEFKDEYIGIWESINGKGSWEKNPWVWVIEFSRILKK